MGTILVEVTTVRRLIAVVMLLGGLGLQAWALSPQEGWELVAAVETGDQGAYTRLLQAYQAGDPEAGTALGVLYLNGVAYPRDLEKTRQYFEWAYTKGSGWAAWGLSFLYANGLGVPSDPQKYLAYAQEGMKRGYPGAKAMYAQALIWGLEGLKQNVEEGARLLKEAVTTEDPVALNVAARFLAFTNLPGLPKDPKLARAYWEKAAAKGYFLARGFLAYDLFFGVGGAPDQKRALELAKPFVGFDPFSTTVWSTALYFGQGGLPQNRPEACRMAKELRAYSGTATIYGLCILEGVAPGERALGFAYLLFGAAHKEPLAQSLVPGWEKRLTPEEINRAKELLKKLP